MCDRVHLWMLKYSCIVESICIENFIKILILLVFLHVINLWTKGIFVVNFFQEHYFMHVVCFIVNIHMRSYFIQVPNIFFINFNFLSYLTPPPPLLLPHPTSLFGPFFLSFYYLASNFFTNHWKITHLTFFKISIWYQIPLFLFWYF